MATACSMQRACVMLSSILVLLASCGVPDQQRVAQASVPTVADAPTMTAAALTYAAATSTAMASEPPTIIPSPYSTQTPSPLPTPLATLIPLATPATPQSEPQVADTLPLDQPWVSGPGGLLAVDTQGRLTKLGTSFDNLIDRPGKPPLFINYDTESFTTFDPLDGSRATIKFNIGEQWPSLCVSPDGKEIAIDAPIETQTSREERLFVADLQTDTARLVFAHRFNYEVSDDPYDGWYNPGTIAWVDNVLYLHVQMSASNSFWKLDLNQPHPTPEYVYGIGEGYWTSQPNGTLLLGWGMAINPVVDLVDLSTGATKQIGQMTSPSFAPDGKTVAYAVYADSMTEAQLNTYDIATGATMRLGMVDNVRGGISWSDDGQRILVQSYDEISGQNGQGSSRSARRIRLFTRDGTLLGEIQLPEDVVSMRQLVDSLHLIGDDQLLFPVREGGRVSLRSVPFRAGDTPRYPAVWLPGSDDAIYYIVYVPPT